MLARTRVGEKVDKALDAIERDNAEQLRGVLPKIYARAPIQPAKLGSLIETVAKIGFDDDPDRARDILGRTYEYFIREFARSEGHRGGEFYTPASVTRLLVEMLEPFEGRVLDPACGSGGLFIQSAEFVKAHGGRGPADLDPRPGEQPGHLAYLQDEPRDFTGSAATSSSVTRSSTTSFPAARRLSSGESTLQPEEVGCSGGREGCALAVRRAA